jgi:hypothetical protein
VVDQRPIKGKDSLKVLGSVDECDIQDVGLMTPIVYLDDAS